ncbi:hypothetical protein JIMMER1_97 [Brevibacillus phage Jimmer1]|uniref:Uncharacterized protein n=4 Tax=Jimmervirus TaxID=1984788 RepID=S5M5I9_9CAUD|nr:hypothetical protein AVV10_gp097 [Brevibacillus phage Osiris]YP_009226407.1 hypothetical protein AXJ21_gp097 [Brevibacillus phage Jimmer1]YP_009606524.1 hypothetical protein FDI01_gp097 [Brevibacillus phage Jimmer2]ALA48107.1 hypothetical protein POWDER_97 [Brevibacillus phage Powder]AGR47226.1 hypothetical protein JIMMER2_97 [Brevibacillus phage Jimmer2]AGR47325.1 hypothetical protein JIMMER1_97 [Brevibacillus phage Jimmer1]ALA07398.1 hypothetical protein OSIRIS_97 [Brevibacillus phage Os
MKDSSNLVKRYSWVKTFTPIIPAGTGPTYPSVDHAIHEILSDILEMTVDSHVDITDQELNKFTDMLMVGLGIEVWDDGTYIIFPDYEIKIETMERWKFDKMPEFNGY